MPSRKTYIKYFRHFAFRLAGRYGILITFEYYCLLCSIFPKDGKVKSSEGRNPVYEGYLTINGKEVRVVKDLKRHKMLLTALPEKKKKPVTIDNERESKICTA